MSEQTIFRVAHRSLPFTSIGNAMLRDTRLSIEARGCLAMILSYPADWQFKGGWLCREARVGRDKAQSIIRELIACGYCKRVQARNGQRLGPVEYAFTDLTSQQPENPVAETEKPSVETEKPSVQPDPQRAENTAALQIKDNNKQYARSRARENPAGEEGAFSVSAAMKTKGGLPRDTEESVADYAARLKAEGRYNGKLIKPLPRSKPL